MAYLIFNTQGELYRIASDDSEKNNLDINPDFFVKVATDEEFNKIRLETHSVSLDGENFIFIEYGKDASGNVYFNSNDLSYNINNLLVFFRKKLEYNPDHPRADDINSYISTLENFDTSTITFPLDKNWQEYCQENSITFISPLQIS